MNLLSTQLTDLEPAHIPADRFIVEDDLTRQTPSDYDSAARTLTDLFNKNIRRYTVPEPILKAGPTR